MNLLRVADEPCVAILIEVGLPDTVLKDDNFSQVLIW